MTKSVKYGGFGSFADLLLWHIEAGNLTRKTIELAGRVSESTVARWVRGEVLPDLNDICLLIQNLPRVVADDIRGLIPQRVEVDMPSLDRNQDGRLCFSDATDVAIGTMGQLQGVLCSIRAAAHDGRLCDVERGEIVSGIAATHRALTDVQYAISNVGAVVMRPARTA